MGWINAGILAGLATLGIPIVIHLLRSRRYRTAHLGTLRFLKHAVRESARWRRLRDLLLLLARLAAFALLTLAFARPFLKNTDDSETREMAALVLVDASGSMNGQSLGVSNVELAREAALHLLADLPDSVDVTVAAFASAVWEVPDLQEAEIVAGGRTDYGKTLRWAADRLTVSEGERKKVFLVTDMQTAGLPSEPFRDWPLDTTVEVVPLVAPGAWNVAVTGVLNPSPYLGRGTTIEVSLACFGECPAGEVDVALEIEGQQPLQVSAPLRSGLVEFSWKPALAGLYRGVARIESGDAYAWDNERHFAFAVREPHQVLLVNGAPGRTRYGDETYFLGKALNVPVREGGQSPFKAQQRPRLGSLDGFSVVALCNVAELHSGEIRGLYDFVAKGGGLIYFLGDRVRPEAYRALSRAGIFPGRLTAQETAIPRQIFEWDATHPALALFDAHDRGDLSRIVFRDAFRVAPTPGAAVLARLSDGAAAIVEERLKDGRVMAVANPCDRDWSDWPTERIFLPLMRELLDWLAGARKAEDAVLEKTPGGEEAAAPGLIEGEPLTVVAPDPLEADVRCLDETAFREKLGVGPAPVEKAGIANESLVPFGHERENEIWPYLVLGLLLVMFLENFLSDRGRT